MLTVGAVKSKADAAPGRAKVRAASAAQSGAFMMNSPESLAAGRGLGFEAAYGHWFRRARLKGPTWPMPARLLGPIWTTAPWLAEPIWPRARPLWTPAWPS